MTAELAFTLANALVVPWWALWLVAPRSHLARRAASHSAIFVALAAAYAVLGAAALVGSGLPGAGYAAWKQVLGTPLGFLAGWIHYLVVDLFVGAWILRESGRIGVGVRPYLFFAFLLGPLGLGVFLVRRGLKLRSFGQLGAGDLV